MNYTSIEQSKKLLELGLSPESADMYYLRIVGETYDKYGELISLENNLCKVEIDSPNRLDYPEDDILPCWSVGALLEVMPKHIFSEDRIKNYTPVLHIGEKNVIWYQHMNEFLHIEHADTSIEAAYSMVVWLLENGYIEKEPKTSSE